MQGGRPKWREEGGERKRRATAGGSPRMIVYEWRAKGNLGKKKKGGE